MPPMDKEASKKNYQKILLERIDKLLGEMYEHAYMAGVQGEREESDREEKNAGASIAKKEEILKLTKQLADLEATASVTTAASTDLNQTEGGQNATEAQGGSNPTSTDLDKILRRHLDDRPEGYSLFKQAIDDYTARVANKAVADALWRLKAKQGAAKLYSPEMLVVGVGYIHSELAALTKEDV